MAVVHTDCLTPAVCERCSVLPRQSPLPLRCLANDPQFLDGNVPTPIGDPHPTTRWFISPGCRAQRVRGFACRRYLRGELTGLAGVDVHGLDGHTGTHARPQRAADGGLGRRPVGLLVGLAEDRFAICLAVENTVARETGAALNASVAAGPRWLTA